MIKNGRERKHTSDNLIYLVSRSLNLCAYVKKSPIFWDGEGSYKFVLRQPRLRKLSQFPVATKTHFRNYLWKSQHQVQHSGRSPQLLIHTYYKQQIYISTILAKNILTTKPTRETTTVPILWHFSNHQTVHLENKMTYTLP